MYTIKKILIPTDFSEYSAAAVDYAQALAAKLQAELHLLYVSPSKTKASSDEASAHATGMGQIREEGTAGDDFPHAAMRKFVAEHFDEFTYVEEAVVQGEPEVEILAYAKKHGIDLIIMATHGRTGLAHMLMGSIAEKIVRTSPVPVLTVKPIELIEPLVTGNEVESELHLGDKWTERERSR